MRWGRECGLRCAGQGIKKSVNRETLERHAAHCSHRSLIPYSSQTLSQWRLEFVFQRVHEHLFLDTSRSAALTSLSIRCGKGDKLDETGYRISWHAMLAAIDAVITEDLTLLTDIV